MAADADREPLSLHDAAEMLLEECRMVLPGVQALFGFQMVVVFSHDFAQRLGPGEQRVHLVAIAFVIVAAAVLMTPAALQRQTGARQVTRAFLRLSTRLLLWGMVPLALGTALDLYLVARVILGAPAPAAVVAAAVLACIAGLWFALPHARRSGHERAAGA